VPLIPEGAQKTPYIGFQIKRDSPLYCKGILVPASLLHGKPKVLISTALPLGSTKKPRLTPSRAL